MYWLPIFADFANAVLCFCWVFALFGSFAITSGVVVGRFCFVVLVLQMLLRCYYCFAIGLFAIGFFAIADFLAAFAASVFLFCWVFFALLG